MSELSEQEAAVGAGYFSSHPFLSTDVEIVGSEALVGINAAVGAVHQASSHLISPCYDPRGIHE
jgi:hypothetical protein